jgi:hypothetical protein
MELLFRTPGFARWEVRGGFDGRPLEHETDEMVWTAWIGLMATTSHPSPYEAPELYDLVLEHFTDDLAFWLARRRPTAARYSRSRAAPAACCSTCSRTGSTRTGSI